MFFRATEHLPNAGLQLGSSNLRDRMSTPERHHSAKRQREAETEVPASPGTPPCQDAVGFPNRDRASPPDTEACHLPSILTSATSLIRVTSQSPLILSALGALNRRGASLSEESCCSAHDSLAVVLALAVRAGCEEHLDREDVLLTLLWMADSWMDAHHSSPTHALMEYLEPLCESQPQVAARLARIVPTLVRSMVSLQAALLQRLDWRLRLHPDADVARAMAALAAVHCARPGGGEGVVQAIHVLAAQVLPGPSRQG